MAERKVLLAEVIERLGQRQLVWIGTRGEDALSISDVPQLSASFTLTSALDRLASVAGQSLEQLTGERVDLDTFDIDEQLRTDAVREFREQILRTLSSDSAIFEYRPSAFSSAIAFARQDRCLHLGLFSGHQFAFEHKPWLETSIAGLGIPHIPWTYVADLDQLDTVELLARGPVMLRRSRTTGGVGLVRLDDADRLTEMWPDEPEAFVSVAPFIDGGIPLNVSGVVWKDGVTVHPASVQLIGIEGCTLRPFGYCGNDFGAARSLGSAVLDQVEVATRAIGTWMGGYGYLGAFGVDFLVKDGVALFTEVNPRFQGSTHATCRLAIEADRSCLMLEHLAAFLGIASSVSTPLRTQMDELPDLAHIVIHNVGPPGRIDTGPLLDHAHRATQVSQADVLTYPQLLTARGATIARLTIRDRLTDSGFDLRPFWRSLVDSMPYAAAAPGPEPS